MAGNFMWLSALQVAGYVFPLITMPYLARIIGVEGFGKIAFASAIMVWIQTIADWGFNLTATRDVAQNREKPQEPKSHWAVLPFYIYLKKDLDLVHHAV